MPVTNVARDKIAKLIVGAPTTPWTSASAHIGVGNGTTAFAASQTDLQGASLARKAMDATFPTLAANLLTYRSTFGTADANFSWDEWGVFNASTAGDMLCRKVESLGVKPNTQTWQLQAALTVVAS